MSINQKKLLLVIFILVWPFLASALELKISNGLLKESRALFLISNDVFHLLVRFAFPILAIKSIEYFRGKNKIKRFIIASIAYVAIFYPLTIIFTFIFGCAISKPCVLP